jgi:hypothetical protein
MSQLQLLLLLLVLVMLLLLMEPLLRRVLVITCLMLT